MSIAVNKQILEQMDTAIKAIANLKNDRSRVEQNIKSLGRDLLEEYARLEAEERKKIESGLGSFTLLNEHQNQIVEIKKTNKEREGYYSKWRSLNSNIETLETKLETLRDKTRYRS